MLTKGHYKGPFNNKSSELIAWEVRKQNKWSLCCIVTGRAKLVSGRARVVSISQIYALENYCFTFVFLGSVYKG